MTEHIQINDVAPRIHYDADGVQLAFTYPFAIFKASNLEVWLGDVRQDTGFTVSGAGISSGGSVLFAVPPPAATRVTLRRRLILERVSDYQADGIIRAKTLNDELDYQVAALQQVAEDVGRAVKFAPTSALAAEITLPEPAAGRGLKWNSSGSALVNSDHDMDIVGDVVQAAADALVAAEMAGTARDQAVAAAGGVRISANDAVISHLGTKVVGGSGISVTETGDGADERLVIAATMAVPQSVADRLAFLEQNLAVTVLRDQIDTGWSVLKMIDGVADEFEDETGINLALSASQTYDATGDYYGNPAVEARITGAIPSAPLGGTAANINDGNPATMVGVYIETNTGAAVAARLLAKLDFGANVSLVKAEAVGAFNSGAGGSVSGHGFYTSTDGTNWALFGSTFSVANASATYVQTGSVTARYLAYAVPGISWSCTPTIADLNGYCPVVSANMAIQSNVYAADAVPTEGRMVMLHQPVAAITLNTDIIAEISRNGGTDWAVAALTDEGAFDPTTRILAATVDLSAQPAGASMVWRLRTLNNKEQRLHGVWLQWR